jgi:peptidoglycan-associated lipoprotein
VYFDTNRFEVKPQFEGPLEARAKELLRNPQLEVKIEGHADRRGGDELNLILSQRRAQAVRDVLLGKGVPEERMEAQGYGASRPADPANTPDAWAKNRRVEIVPR